MSRCFPFPPPGYEQKARPDDVNILIKEKHKQKKHKDKKDKDKKEKRERKEKERSEGKHKEDKERKEKKHRDKKDKKKDKRRSSEEKQIVGSSDNQSSEKLGLDNKPSDGIQDNRILVELGKRVRNDGGATDNRIVQKIKLTEQRKANLPGKVVENSNGILAEAYDDIKNKSEHSRMANGQTLKLDANGFRNGFGGNFSGENQIRVEGGFYQADKVEKRKEGNSTNEHENNVGKEDGIKNKDQDKNRKAEDKKRKKEKRKERSEEKIKQRASDGNVLDFRDSNPSDLLKESHDRQGKLPKHEEPVLSNGFLHDNGIRPNNMSRPVISSDQVIQNGSGFHPSQSIGNSAMEKHANGKLSSSQSVSKNGNNTTAENGRAVINNHVVNNGHISSHPAANGWKTGPHQTTTKVAKLEQIVNNCRFPISHPLVENGRKTAGPTIDKPLDRQGPDSNGTLEDKTNTSSRPSSATKMKVVSTPKKPPHPDLKYLSQILTVPKVECPQFDDEDWLFGCLDSQAKRPKLASSQTEQVWAEAIRMESADVIALPYVIPY